MSPLDVLDELVAMSRRIGQPEWDAVILGEGNTSARVDEDSFWVKASGMQMTSAGREGYVRVRASTLLEFFNSEESTDDGVTAALEAATIEPAGVRPSVEAALHAILLSYEGVDFVAHTHPTAIIALLASQRAEELVLGGRLTAEEIVLCGPVSCYLPYFDPGIKLARAVRDTVERFLDDHGRMPQQIMVQNHGLIVPGKTAEEVANATQFAIKSARILAGTMTFGGPHYLPAREVERIDTRPDEAVRKRRMGWKV